MAILALLKGEPERARAMFANMPDAANRDWGLALAEHDLGHPDAAARALQAFVAESPFEYYRLAVVCSRIGNRDAAFAALDRAYETNDPALQAIMIDPLLADLRTDARYEALLARMGLTGSDPRALRAS
jgi:tetratricopeptide (TPR) repeat protein